MRAYVVHRASIHLAPAVCQAVCRGGEPEGRDQTGERPLLCCHPEPLQAQSPVIRSVTPGGSLLGPFHSRRSGSASPFPTAEPEGSTAGPAIGFLSAPRQLRRQQGPPGGRSQPHQVLALGALGKVCFTSWCLSFPICTMGMIPGLLRREDLMTLISLAPRKSHQHVKWRPPMSLPL